MTILLPGTASLLKLKHVFQVPRERVFHAWTAPDWLKKWMGETTATVPSVEVDLRIGGQYRIGVKRPDADLFFIVGIYREIKAPEKLVYTWAFEGPLTDHNETLVTVEFHAVGMTTEVILTHARFPDIATRDLHLTGWQTCFERLAALDLT